MSTKQIDFGRRVVEIEARPRAGGDAEPVVQRLRAVVAGADRDALLVEQLGDVVRMRLRRREAHDAGLVLGRRAEDPQAVDLLQPLVRVASTVRARAARSRRGRCVESSRSPRPAPMAGTIGGVPASNLAGSSAGVKRSRSRGLIMLPPPRNGGIASSSSCAP